MVDRTPPEKYDALIEELKQILRSKKWEEDRFGNFVKTESLRKVGTITTEATRYRYKFKKLVLEKQFRHADGKTWANIISCYYKDIDIVNNQIHFKKNIGGY